MILNDEEHTFPYVIEMLMKLFRHDLPKAEELTWRIHTTGRAVVYTTHKELAEMKRDQVIAYGADPLSANSKGPDALLRRAGAHGLNAATRSASFAAVSSCATNPPGATASGF